MSQTPCTRVIDRRKDNDACLGGKSKFGTLVDGDSSTSSTTGGNTWRAQA